MSKKKAYATAELLGASIEDDGLNYQLVAPAGKINAGSLTHFISYDYSEGITCPYTGENLWRVMLDDLKEGFETCDNLSGECDCKK